MIPRCMGKHFHPAAFQNDPQAYAIRTQVGLVSPHFLLYEHAEDAETLFGQGGHGVLGKGSWAYGRAET